ncbi:ankyrin repeat domain-containing protein [Candidatus Micrarchaeota archaeon]|nr:ankyrin repeat domain-containing protein [Candidatus Micrarchaeota archaeon]
MKIVNLDDDEVFKRLLYPPENEHPAPNENDKKLIDSALLGGVERAKKAIKEGANLEVTIMSDWTPLILTGIHGNKEVAEILIGEGADIEAKDWAGWTPLMRAAEQENKETVKMLIQKGADVIYAFLKEDVGVKNVIKGVIDENPNLIDKEERFLLSVISEPEKIPFSEKQKVRRVLTKFSREKRINAEEAHRIFRNLMKRWNERIEIKEYKLRKPKQKSGRGEMKRLQN